MKITPKEVKMVAEWRWPDDKWAVTTGGQVIDQGLYDESGVASYFDLFSNRNIQAITMKLQQDHGWKVRETTQSGQKIWRAENGKGGCIESPSLQRVLVMVVMRVMK